MRFITRRRFLRNASLAGLTLATVGCATSNNQIESSDTEEIPSPTETAASLPSTPASSEAVGTEPRPTEEITAQASPSPATEQEKEQAYLSVVHGSNVNATTREAIALIGGMERFVKPGYDVIIKPNICNANHGPEYASTTNPQVVATLVSLCIEAGADRVRVMDYPFAGTAEAAYEQSGIRAAVESAGGQMEIMASAKFVEVAIPDGKDLNAWRFYRPILDADLVINVPIAKHHSLATLTLAGKNLMGTIENRPAMHRNLGQRIADITSRVHPQLTVIDAIRILTAHGPTGGDLNDVQRRDTVIASHDLVAADAYATTLFDRKAQDIAYVVKSAEMGLGQMNLKNLDIAEVEV